VRTEFAVFWVAAPCSVLPSGNPEFYSTTVFSQVHSHFSETINLKI